MKHLIICLSVFALFLVSSCQKNTDEAAISALPSEYDGELTREWFKLVCTLVKETPGMFPPQASRAFGYTGITLYETVVQGWPDAQSLAGQLNGLNSSMLPMANTGEYEYNWALASNAAFSVIITKMFDRTIKPENRSEILALEDKWKTTLSEGVDPEVRERSISFGQAMANAIYEYSKTDGGHEQYVDPFQLPYTWPTKDGAWVPTGAAANPLAPRWANNRPFLTVNITDCQPSAHCAYSTVSNDEFYKEALNVYNVVTNATAEEVEIAKFWADDPFNTCTPTGHTFNIMVQLLEEHDANLAMSAVGFAKLAIAENDAFIACWKAKYDYFLIRPVTYIRQNIDPNFNTLIGTPPFPAYTSGHATEAAAGSRIFTNMFTSGDGYYQFTDRSQLQFGFSVRNYSNFDDMATECANSRLYGGIHYNMDNSNGLKMGKAVGDNVNTRIRWPKSF
jgi:hypothetical protein